MLAEQGADVGQGAGGDDPCGTWFLGAEGGGHGLDAGDGGRRRERSRQELGAVQAGLAVDVGRGVEGGSLEGLVEADVEGDVIVFADGGEEGCGVAGRVSVRELEMERGLKGWYILE